LGEAAANAGGLAASFTSRNSTAIPAAHSAMRARMA